MRRMLTLLIAITALTGCATLEELAGVHRLRFVIDRVSDGRLAGVDLERVRSWRDLTPGQALALAGAVRSRQVPFTFTLHLEATNPAENTVAARLVGLDWTLRLDDRDTVSGALDHDIRVSPGETADIPLAVELDLLRFFERDARALLDAALAVAGGSAPDGVALVATPTVTTPLGPMTYPGKITITPGGAPGARR